MDEGTLRQRRFRKLLRELHNNGAGLSQAEIAKRLGVSPGLVSQILLEHKHAGEETIDKAKAALDLDEDYFSAKDLGAHASHVDFIGGSPFRATRLEREDRVQALEEYFAEREASGRPVRAKVIDRARMSARSTGMATRTEAAVLVDFLEGVVAREERGDAPPPNDPRAVINEAAGQRALTRKPRRR